MNFGLPGPPNACEPFGPSMPTPSAAVQRFGLSKSQSLYDDEFLDALANEVCGSGKQAFSSWKKAADLTESSEIIGANHSEIKRRSDAEFELVVDKEDSLTEEQFIIISSQHWGFSRRKARAVFYACDSNRNCRLSKREYFMARLAFVEQNLANPQHEILVMYRLRAVFHLYVLARPAQRRADIHATLSHDELVKWVRDMCHGETHVQKMVQSCVLPSLGYNAVDRLPNDCLTMDMFLDLMQGELGENLQRDGLTLDDYWNNNANESQFSRVVLDGRAETLVGTTIQSEYVPSEAVNAETELDTTMRAVGGWRGPYAPRRDEDAFLLAEGILDVAMRWAREFAAKDRRQLGLDKNWKPSGEALKELLNQATHTFEPGEPMGITCSNTGMVQKVIAGGPADTKRIKQGSQIVKVDTVPYSKDALARAENSGYSYQVTFQVSKTPEKQKLERYHAEQIAKLARACQKQLERQPSLVRVPPPVKVFGDLHGQLMDLLLLFGHFGLPTHIGGDIQTTQYVFNGDWVDRGEHQLEVVCVLFALKVLYPMHIYLVRGNHEFRSQNMKMEEDEGENGFYSHCRNLFLDNDEVEAKEQATMVFEAVHKAFEWLPIAALIGGKVLTLHGGIGDGTWGVKDLERVRRPLDDETLEPGSGHYDGNVMDALWSDPSDSDHLMQRGVHRSPRDNEAGRIHLFSPDITKEFCEREGIALIIRSHQFVRQGYKVMHHGHLITLFSAANYFEGDDYDAPNDSAILLLSEDLNAHLRVHPKRIKGLQVVQQSYFQRLTRCLPCC